MTDTDYCCICASDEGVFLDIFTATGRQLGNRSFTREFEKCLSFKVNRDEALSSKICHKCAIELGECYRFVEQHHRAHDKVTKLKKEFSKKCCCLCYSASPKEYLFPLARDFHSTIDLLQKIRECFHEQISKKEAKKRSVCLLCLYHLDMLYDLRILAHCVASKLQQITERKSGVENLPKTETFVVSRKTTCLYKTKVEFPESPSDTDSVDRTMACRRLRSKEMSDQKPSVESKLRKCGQCHSSIEAGIDMFRLYTTGKIVCKLCWITTDPFTADETTKRKQVAQRKPKGTKLCAVFLKDVLQHPGIPKTDKAHRITSVRKGIIYISSSSENEEESNIEKAETNAPMRLRGKKNTSYNKSNTNFKKQLKRSHENLNSICGPNQKKIKINNSNIAETPVPRRSARNQGFDSDNEIAKRKEKNVPNGKHKMASEVKSFKQSETSIDSGDQRAMSITKHRKRGSSAGTSKSVDHFSDSGREQRKIRQVRNKVPLISQRKVTDKVKTQKRMAPKVITSIDLKQQKTSARLKNLGVKSITKSSSAKTLASSKDAKKLIIPPVNYPSNTKSYKCKMCNTVYKNKIIGMKHELTHFKGVEIKIEKLQRDQHFRVPNEYSPASSIIQESTLAEEINLHPDVPSTDIRSEPHADQNNELQTLKSTPQSKKSVEVQGEVESVDFDPIQKTDVNTSPSKESFEDQQVSDDIVLMTNASTNGPADKLVSEEPSGIVSQEKIEKSPDEKKHTDTEPESTSESNSIAVNDNVQVLNETNDRNTDEADEPVGDIEDENLMSQSNEAEAVVVQSAENTRTDGDSGDELESDTDIRIVDTESSTEDSGERLEKQQITADANDFFTPIITDSVVEEPIEEPMEISEDKEISEETSSTNGTSQTSSDVNLISTTKFNVEKTDEVPKNGELHSEETKLNNTPESLIFAVKAVDQDKSTSVVTEILQEVIDLATAEVQKRAENNIIAIPETLENISKEITAMAGKSADIETSCGNFGT